jgi:5-methylcytosine-specific restriction endonuclease McrA
MALRHLPKEGRQRLKWPHPRAATLDHIVPMSCGGGHTYANTQCSHWQCNQLKLARGEGEQLALIG